MNCMSPVVCWGTPTQVTRIDAAGPVADEVCSLVARIERLAVRPPADELWHGHASASSGPGEALQGPMLFPDGLTALINLPDPSRNMRESDEPSRVVVHGERGVHPSVAWPWVPEVDGSMPARLSASVSAEHALVTHPRTAKAIVGQLHRLCLVVFLHLGWQQFPDEQLYELLPGLTPQDVPGQISIPIAQVQEAHRLGCLPGLCTQASSVCGQAINCAARSCGSK